MDDYKTQYWNAVNNIDKYFTWEDSGNNIDDDGYRQFMFDLGHATVTVGGETFGLMQFAHGYAGVPEEISYVDVHTIAEWLWKNKDIEFESFIEVKESLFDYSDKVFNGTIEESDDDDEEDEEESSVDVTEFIESYKKKADEINQATRNLIELIKQSRELISNCEEDIENQTGNTIDIAFVVDDIPSDLDISYTIDNLEDLCSKMERFDEEYCKNEIENELF